MTFTKYEGFCKGYSVKTYLAMQTSTPAMPSYLLAHSVLPSARRPVDHCQILASMRAIIGKHICPW